MIWNWKEDVGEGIDVVKWEKKRLKYAIADLLKAREGKESKIKRIDAICEE